MAGHLLLNTGLCRRSDWCGDAKFCIFAPYPGNRRLRHDAVACTRMDGFIPFARNGIHPACFTL
jgi:hypothetical protein